MNSTPGDGVGTEGGSIEAVQEGGEIEVAPGQEIQFGDTKEAEQRARIWQWLVLLLTGLIAAQYCAVFVLEWNTTKRIEHRMSVFNTTLPVVSGLVGSPVTYYFTRGGK
jgi:hypothetical protein